MDVDRTDLPGIGVRYEFVTKRNVRLGLVTHHSGRRDFLVYDPDDPDTTLECLVLSQEEASVIAELLGGARIVERLNKLHRGVEGLESRQIRIDASSPYAGRTLGDTQTRTRTGASIVAVVRRDEVFASPSPDFRFEAGDMVVAVGTDEGVRAVAVLLSEG